MDQFLELYESVYKDMYRLAYYYMGNPQDAEDVVGEAVLKAYEKFGFLRRKESFRYWIFKILVNECVSELRKKKRKKPNILIEDSDFQGNPNDHVAVEEILSVLSEGEKRIVLLFVFAGYKGDEIAKLLHMKPSTVRSKYRRALKKMELVYRNGG